MQKHKPLYLEMMTSKILKKWTAKFFQRHHQPSHSNLSHTNWLSLLKQGFICVISLCLQALDVVYQVSNVIFIGISSKWNLVTYFLISPFYWPLILPLQITSFQIKTPFSAIAEPQFDASHDVKQWQTEAFPRDKFRQLTNRINSMKVPTSM